MRDVMVDIETLGGGPGSVIVSIGAVEFGDRGLCREFYRVIDVLDSLLAGLRVDDATIEWWRMQTHEAKAALYAADARRCLADALTDFARFLDGDEPRVWAKGPDFDLVLLQAAYKAAGQPIPWKYRNARDVRTILALKDAPVAEANGHAKHHALHDARYQAAQVMAVYRALGLEFASAASRAPSAPTETK